jgi:hypothetical protein
MDTTIPMKDAALAPRARRVRDDGVAGLSPINAEHPEQRAALLAALAATLNVLPVIKAWALWASGGTGLDMRNYAGVEIQVTAAGTATFTRSGDDVTYAGITATSVGSSIVSPLVPGFYNLKGGGFLKWVGTGTILIRGYN